MNYKGKRRRPKCFTLIELIVVLVILGILAALAIPTFNAIRARGTQTVATADATTLARYASNTWGLYQGKNGDGQGAEDVACGSGGTGACTPDDMMKQAAKESGFDVTADPWEKGNTTVDAGSAVDTWELVAEPLTANVSCATITYANQLFTVAETACPAAVVLS